MSSQEYIYFRCLKHPDRMGFVDLGIEVENRYPCRQCYKEIVEQKKREFIHRHCETVARIKENKI